MRLCFIICGQPRSIDLVLKNIEELFYNHQINYYICLTNNYTEYEKEYSYNFDINNIILNSKIIKLLLVNDFYNSEYRNLKNNYVNMKGVFDIKKTSEKIFQIYPIISKKKIFKSEFCCKEVFLGGV